MIEMLRQQVASGIPAEEKINRLREALQLLCLKVLHDKNYFSKIAFTGGTALRLLYDMKRFSEDLDFSVINNKEYDFSSLVSTLEREFVLYGLKIDIKARADKTVQSCMLGFPGLLKEMGLSNLEGQKLSIKLEVDSNPPLGWQIENTVINKIYVLNITHFTMQSLYAAKLHACFFRRYTKGRDFYDLMWYLTKKTRPNYDLLNNAIKQTEGKNPGVGEHNIRDFILKRIAQIDFDSIKKDVERFLEDKGELALLNESIVSKAIEDQF